MKSNRFTAIAFLLLTAFWVFTFHSEHKEAKEKRMKLAGYASEWGCFEGIEIGCSALQKETERGGCFERGLKYCPRESQKYEAWLRNVK